MHDTLNEHIPDATAQPLCGIVSIGTAAETAKALQNWSDAGHIDGFTILPPTNSAFAVFVAEVVPLLRNSELPGKQVSGLTLRDRLSLKRPVHPASKLERAS
jgi:alkanesulfonate monooxygenase SsuD/methylene tetrahydromethanopterin reductase-like flavin-dependent oxidoreductase (luciferase family)